MRSCTLIGGTRVSDMDNNTGGHMNSTGKLIKETSYQ